MDPGLAGESSPEPKRPASDSTDPINPAEPECTDPFNTNRPVYANPFDPVEPVHADDAFIPVELVRTDLSNHDVQEPNQNECTSNSSTTTDTSDGDDFFQIDPLGLGHPVACSPIGPISSSQLPAHYKDDEEISLPAKYASRMQQSEDINQAKQSSGFKPNQSPPLPPTARANDIPDPNRIPSSVFTRTKSTGPMEWSVASNESLFSIHMGNSSFSRDHSFLSGFSPCGFDYQTPPISPMSSSMQPASPLPPPIPAASTSRPPSLPVQSSPTQMGTGQDLQQPEAAAEANAEAMQDVLRAAAEKHDIDKGKSGQEVAIHYGKSVSHQSDGSNASFQSFAFPILTGDGRNYSVKVEPEHQRMQFEQVEPRQSPKVVDNQETEAPAPAPAPAPANNPTPEAGKGWFSCFSCCPSCCNP